MSDVGQVALEDSNVALMNSDLAKSVREAAAQFEPEWEGAGKQVGIEIWRSENLGVKRWEKKEYGKFFDGDSYIVLNTYKVRTNMTSLYSFPSFFKACACKIECTDPQFRYNAVGGQHQFDLCLYASANCCHALFITCCCCDLPGS
jgi:hypothetical protein